MVWLPERRNRAESAGRGLRELSCGISIFWSLMEYGLHDCISLSKLVYLNKTNFQKKKSIIQFQNKRGAHLEIMTESHTMLWQSNTDIEKNWILILYFSISSWVTLRKPFKSNQAITKQGNIYISPVYLKELRWRLNQRLSVRIPWKQTSFLRI